MDNFTLPLTASGELWVFAYGSLMWDRDFSCAQIVQVRVHGWRRAFSLRSTLAWGSEKQPGLCASLHAGGSVAGRALRIEAAQVKDTLIYLKQREAAYLPRSVRGRHKGRPPFPMLAFVHDYNHPRSAAGLRVAEQARLIGQGRGKRGSSLFYLCQTLNTLAADGSGDKDAARLLDMVLNRP